MSVISNILARRWCKMKNIWTTKCRSSRDIPFSIKIISTWVHSYEIIMILFWKYDVDYHCLKQQFELAIFFRKPRYETAVQAYRCFILRLRVSFQFFLDPIIIVWSKNKLKIIKYCFYGSIVLFFFRALHCYASITTTIKIILCLVGWRNLS
jgi:hypothetical protein